MIVWEEEPEPTIRGGKDHSFSQERKTIKKKENIIENGNKYKSPFVPSMGIEVLHSVWSIMLIE